ncbi:hypothetical protein EHR03_13080 [Leptospira mayottensis]|uniref:Uncharacterized protein n=1 Tax=Leptospira mayottensis 200901116 TaxID=1192864 RepID=A0A343US03_9LEPT|nr:hypothetical protein [Leptospira mayottensis]AVH81576.1 hypothetical protein [Leptospira mayottensis 200901116]TGN00357.1 hypothetical protein EHR03_13080 [Leptospira mayottensis]
MNKKNLQKALFKLLKSRGYLFFWAKAANQQSPDVLMILEQRRGFGALILSIVLKDQIIFRPGHRTLFTTHELSCRDVMHKRLGKRNYCARFARGEEQVLKIVEWYLGEERISA